MFGSSGTTVAVQSTETGEADEEGVPPPCPTNDANLTPPKQGEIQCGSLENKVCGQQNEEDATLQLQADICGYWKFVKSLKFIFTILLLYCCCCYFSASTHISLKPD